MSDSHARARVQTHEDILCSRPMAGPWASSGRMRVLPGEGSCVPQAPTTLGSRPCSLPPAQSPATQQTSDRRWEVQTEAGCWTMGFRKGYSLHPPAANRGEEVINKGSCLLSTWNIPGTMTKTRVSHNLLDPKNTNPGGLLTPGYKGNRGSEG